MKDIKLHYFGNTNFFDISFKDGDIELDDSFNSTIITSLFSDARADESEIKQPQNRRGFWGDEISDDPTDPYGSKLWLLDQSRLTDNTVLNARDYARLSLNWFVKTGLSRLIEVKVTKFGLSTIRLFIKIINNDNSVEQKYYDMWRNTGNFIGHPNRPSPPPQDIFMLDENGDYMLDENGVKITLG